MIHINLLPIQEIEESLSRRKELWLAGGGILTTLMVVFLAYFFQYTRLDSVNVELSRQESLMVTIRKQHRAVEQLEIKKTDLETKIRAVRQLIHPGRRTASVHLLADLSSYTPDNLWLTEFSELKGAAKIYGFAVDNQTIAAFTHNLSNSHYFQKVEIRETAREVTTGDSHKIGGTGKISAPDAPPAVPLSKFFIEAHVNYLGEQ